MSRALLFATVMVAAPFAAYGQFGGMPGMPGGGGFGGPPQGPPPACRELLLMRDEVQKHGRAIQMANERKAKATVQGACKLFKNFLDAEARFIKSLEENSRTCGVPGDAIIQAKEGHSNAFGHWQAGLRCGGPGPQASAPGC